MKHPSSLFWPVTSLFLCAVLAGTLFSVWTQGITPPLAQVASGECEPEPDCCAGGGVGCSPGQLAGCSVEEAPVPPPERKAGLPSDTTFQPPPNPGFLPAGQGALTAQQSVAASLMPGGYFD